MSSEENKPSQPSTLGAAVQQVIGAAQSAIGSLVGNPADQQQGEQRKINAEAERDLSDAAVKAGPFTLSSSGAVAQDSTDRTQGSWNQTVGAAKEAVGGLVGSEALRQQGIEQNREGKGQEAQGQLSDLGAGLGDRVTGTVGGAAAQLIGDKDEIAKRQAQHDSGKSLQRGVEADLQKQVDAQQKTV